MIEASNEDVLQEKIKAYKESLKQAKPDMDIALLVRILDMVNGSSEVHVAIDPVDEDGWMPDTPTYAVSKLEIDEDGRFVLRVHDEKHGIAAEKLYEQLEKALKRHSNDKAPVYFRRKGETVQLTDAYSHSLVKERWAGMPFDLVLAVRSAG